MAKLSEILPPDHHAYTEAVEAMHRYHEALNAGAPVTEVERLRQVNDSRHMDTKD